MWLIRCRGYQPEEFRKNYHSPRYSRTPFNPMFEMGVITLDLPDAGFLVIQILFIDIYIYENKEVRVLHLLLMFKTWRSHTS